MFMLPRMVDLLKMPNWVALTVIIGLLAATLAGWYFGVTIRVPAPIGKPVSVALMIVVIVVAVWQVRQSLIAMYKRSDAGRAWGSSKLAP
jgi:hypothetical protein